MVDYTDLFSGEPQTQTDLYEYFFLISPPENIKQEVRRLKEKLKWQIGLDDYNLHSPAHISLFKMKADADWAGSFEQHKILSTLPAFAITVTEHMVFKHGNKSKSLVLKIDDPEPIRNIMRLLLPADLADASKMLPHITIAKNIPNVDFNNISYLSEYDLQVQFACNKVTVLKKRIYNPGKYEKCCEIGLGV